ncbi:hypothetical protein, conserved [Eimeria brunetti]|uniref:Uncharacterized protein n=1 Tax=Eimeria brunetti TaxID=51314 RepID=U6M0T7_9EIME|nr:hypothetical protein, conserved [Eimeria brunetti]
MAMADLGWMNICIEGAPLPPPLNCCSPHLQAVVSELDAVIKDIEGLKEKVGGLQQPNPDQQLRAAVEKELSCCMQRWEQLDKQWQQQVTVLAEDLKKLKTDELKELRNLLSRQTSQLSSLESQVCVLRQLVPAQGAALKAADASLLLLRESIENAIEGIQKNIMGEQKRRAQHEEQCRSQQREMEDAVESLRQDLGALKKSCQQSHVLLLQLKDNLSSSRSSSSSSSSSCSSSSTCAADISSLKKTAQQQAARIEELGKALSAVENHEGRRGKEVEKILSELSLVKNAMQHIVPMPLLLFVSTI